MMIKSKPILLITVGLCMLLLGNADVYCQEAQIWSIDSCMRYAVDHNHTVKQKQAEVDNYKLDKMRAIGNFLPGVSASSGATYSFGRSVDPETNTYNNVSTFQNSYSLQASLPVFRGGSLINEVRRSKAALLLGKAALQEARDNTALETFQAYIDALYYYGTAKLAKKKLLESDSLLYKTQRQEELGLKGMADVAQIKAQQSTDAYNLTRQTNLFETAMLTLKQKMSLPPDSEILLDTSIVESDIINNVRLCDNTSDEVFSTALLVNPTLRQSELNKKIALMNRKISWADILPSISLNGGISTSYYKELHKSGYPNFSSQFNNNLGQYFGISISIPIFNHFYGVTEMKRMRNNYRIACHQYEAQKEELHKLVAQAVQDREGYLKESIQMEKKVEADSIAYYVTRRKFEEGLMTSLDVKNNASTLLESETLLLQSKLTYILKCRLVDYYKGEDIIKE